MMSLYRDPDGVSWEWEEEQIGRGSWEAGFASHGESP
jgi:hypothetical protein